MTGGNVFVMMLVLLVGSAVISSFLDNIPFVATMIPILLTMEASGMDVTPLWWAVSSAHALAETAPSSERANVVLSDIAKKAGSRNHLRFVYEGRLPADARHRRHIGRVPDHPLPCRITSGRFHPERDRPLDDTRARSG